MTEDRPIFHALVQELLSEWGGVKFNTMHLRIEEHLREAGLWTNRVDDCVVVWGADRKLMRSFGSSSLPRHIVFDCENQTDNEWGVRFFHRYGYELHSEMTKRVEALGWGCTVLEKIGPTMLDYVTVVVPTYNSELYVEECLASILSQTHRNLEVILVDDASADLTLAKARQLLLGDQRRHSIIPLPVRIPAGAARQRGVDEAVGNFICCFDSDDVMPSEYLATALEAFEGEVDFVYPRQWWLIPEDGFDQHLLKLQDLTSNLYAQVDPVWRGVIGRCGEARLFENTHDYERGSKLGSCMIMPTVCRGSASQRFDPDLERLQDWDMHLDLLNSGAEGKGFFCAPYIRSRVGSITNNTPRVLYEGCRDRVIEKHELPRMPKLLILPLNSNGEFEQELAGPRIRGHQIAPHIHGAEVGDLTTLRDRWRQFDAFYFVCAPTPAVVGWVLFLGENEKRVLFDVCVEYWSQDYLFRGYDRGDFVRCLHEVWQHVEFVCSSKGLARSLTGVIGKVHTDIHVVEDSVMPSLNLKESYELTGLLSWCGTLGNMTELLNYSLELERLTGVHDATVRLITEEQPMRIPFKWEWRKWSVETEEQLIAETDVYLLPRLNVGSFSHKGRGKLALASMLGMPIVEVCEGVDWERTLSVLLQSQKERERSGRTYLKRALEEFVTPLATEKLTEILLR